MAEKNYNSIVKRLKSTRNSIGRWSAFEGTVDLIAFISGFIFILWSVTWIFWPGPVYRVVLVIAGVAGILILLAFKVFKPLLKGIQFTKIALRLEKFYGKLQSRLIGALELYDKLSVNKENYSVELIEKTIEDASDEIRDLDFNAAVYKKKNPYKRFISAVFLIALAYAASSQTFSYVKQLYAQPLADIKRPTLLQLSITPLFQQSVKNDDVTVRITALGEKTRRVDLNFKFDDEKWVKVAAEKLSDESKEEQAVYSYTFRKIKRDIEYYAEAKAVKSEVGKITVIDPPGLVDVSIALEYPEYTGLDNQVLPNNDGSVTALKGTKVLFNGKLSKPVENAILVFDDGGRKKLTVNDNKVNGRFVLKKSGSYHIDITDHAGLKNVDPIEYDLICLEDYPPQVQISFPAVDIDLDERMIVPLQAVLYDDFGFSKLELIYWTFSDGRESDKMIQLLESDFGQKTEDVVEYDWFIEPLHMLPGDLVYYYLKIYDNDAVSGPKSSESKTYSARLPSMDEIMADITGSQEKIFEDFEEAVSSQKELKKELEQLSKEMLKFSEVDWEKKQQIQNTLDRQEDISEKLNQIAEQMDETIEKFEKNQMAATEMLEKMEEIRELFEEVASPELKEAMKKLQDALKEMDPEKIMEAMKNFELSVEQINENLDRMLSLLKKYQLEQKLDTLAKMAEKLAKEQSEINEQLGQCQDKSDFSDMEKPQQQQKQGLNNLRDQFQQAQQMNTELNMLSEQQMQQANDKVNSKELDQAMSEMMSSLGMCNKGQCKKSGEKLKKDFKEMAEMFQKMLEQMQQQQLTIIKSLLKKAIADVLYLSHNQESVIDSTVNAINHLDSKREMASRQKDIETATNRTAQNISEITKETLFLNTVIMRQIGAALSSMQKAIEELNGRYSSQAKNNQIKALSALNQTIATLMSSLDQASQCQSSGTGMKSLMESLSKMGQNQQKLNQQCNNMMPMPLPGQQMMGLAQQQALQRLSAEQKSLGKRLEELLKEHGEGSGEILGRLDDLAEEMKKVADEMTSRNFSQRTVKRQNRILSRLLDAQRSAHRRDYSRRRQARTTDDIIRRGPGALIPGNIENEKLAEDIKKALTEKYPRRYENQIKGYFKALAEDEANEE